MAVRGRWRPKYHLCKCKVTGEHSLDVQSQMGFLILSYTELNLPIGQMQAVLAWADQLEHGRVRTHENPED